MCWKCGKAIIADGPLGRSATCDACGADSRSCKNCRFYSPGSWHDCLERVEDEVRDKERANFCDRFQLNPAYKTDRPAGAAPGPASTARDAFDGLFGN